MRQLACVDFTLSIDTFLWEVWAGNLFSHQGKFRFHIRTDDDVYSWEPLSCCTLLGEVWVEDTNTYMAVPDRNRIIFHCVFHPLCISNASPTSTHCSAELLPRAGLVLAL